MSSFENPLLMSTKLNSKNEYHGKKLRGMYELELTPDLKMDEQKKILSNLSTLSLFKEPTEEPVEMSTNERPVTPINESIRSPPKTLATLCKFVRRRINPRSHWTHISVDDQKSLGAVILGEVNAVWPTFRKQVEDPFLTDRQNKELQRRITVHVVTVCEQLFLYHCSQVKVLNSRGIFSHAANLSRVRGQLALDADKYLNLLSVRRHIVADLKKTSGKDSMMLTKRKDPITPLPPKSPSHLSFRSLFQSSRPKEQKQAKFKMGLELKDLGSRMPSIDLEQAYSLLPTKRLHDEDSVYNEDFDVDYNLQFQTFRQQPTNLPLRSLNRKWDSEPTLNIPGLLEESDPREETESPTAQTRMNVSPHPAAEKFHQRVSSAPKLLTRVSRSRGKLVDAMDHPIDPKQDLANLMARAKFRKRSDDDDDTKDIPPLIQAITRCQEQDEKQKKMKLVESELDERKALFELEESAALKSPTNPQPAVMQVKMPSHANPLDHSSVIIRTSDINIPDKVDLPIVTLEMYGPLYNDLTGEISPATVKELDSNLFQGEELKEVYDEIMKTVPNTHLHFDSDPMVVEPTAEVNLDRILASSSLSRPRSQQIINFDLTKRGHDPPWAGEPQTTWERKNRPLTSAMGSNASHNAVDKMSRAYASWLAWWKSTVTTDDYMKFLATQDTDFLGVIFHFYDSEASESIPDSEAKLARLEADRKRDQIMADIRSKKEHFIRGVWNVNSVIMGGLGKYPALEDYEESKVAEVPRNPAPSPISLASSDESADSESSLHYDVSSRHKSASPRRRHRSAVPFEVLSSSEDELPSCSKVELIAPQVSGVASDSGLSKQGSDCEDAGKMLRSFAHDDSSSGYASKDDVSTISGKFRINRARKQATLKKNTKAGAVQPDLLTTSYRKEWQVQEKPCNLLRGFYKSATDRTTSQHDRSMTSKSLVVDAQVSLQSRLEVVWKKLQMSGGQRLETALKYSTDLYMPSLAESVSAWEEVTGLIVSREQTLHELELFERDASDPARFFDKGKRGSSSTRLLEAKTRSKLYHKLDTISDLISTLLTSIHARFNDVITFAGRPYQDKMKWDRVEMLYWLQQERRSLGLATHGHAKQLRTFARDNNLTLKPVQSNAIKHY